MSAAEAPHGPTAVGISDPSPYSGHVSATGLLGPAEIRELAGRLELRPTKRLGQNFVIDPNTVRRIVRTAEVSSADVILEIGPGLGSLTLGLLETGAQVVAVEVDERLATLLPETVGVRMPEALQRLTVVTADALALLEIPGPPPTVVVANLPYNISVPVLLTLLQRFESLQRGLVMVQAEVADRITAVPGSRIYGIPSAKMAWYAQARRVGAVGRKVFWPEPNVDSGLVAFSRRVSPPGDRAATFTLIDAAFAQRRKTLRAALAQWAGSPANAEALCRAAAVDPGARGEALDVTDFARLALAHGDGASI